MSDQRTQSRMKHLFTKGFTAMDIAEPLPVFDCGAEALSTQTVMVQNRWTFAGIMRDGAIVGYVEQQTLDHGLCADHMKCFDQAALVDEADDLRKVVACLSARPYCFVSALGRVDAIITPKDFGKPPVRMWLFGMITIVEMFISRRLEELYPGGAWKASVSPSRLEKAEELQAERRRRGQEAGLLDCLQLGDKAAILMKSDKASEDLNFRSKSEAKQSLKDFQSLRNNLAHGQDVVAYDWDAILMMAGRLDRILTRV